MSGAVSVPLLPVDHLLALVLAVFFPIRSATFGYRRLAQAAEPDVPRVRHALYRQALVIQWTLATGVIALWRWQRRPWHGLGLVWHASGWAIGAVALFALFVTMVAAQLPRALSDPETMARIRRRLANVRRMMPERGDEMGMFYALSFTAGVCEELLYRGYLLWYLLHFMPWPFAAAVAVLLFAIGHSYQGARGILTTGVAGTVLMTMVLVTGSLYLSMVAHALMDAYSGTLGRRAYAAEPHGAASGATAEIGASGPADGSGHIGTV